MKTSTAGRQAIARHEGNKLKAYPDPATGGDPFTIGCSHMPLILVEKSEPKRCW